MEVYYKFASAKDYESISLDWHYTTFADLKTNIYLNKCSGGKGKGARFNSDNLIVTNAQTNVEYVDGQVLIPKDTFVIIRRVPQLRCAPIIIPLDKPLFEKQRLGIKSPTGIHNKSTSDDGSNALPTRVVSVFKPKVAHLPHCPLCRLVIEDAVFAKCCFRSFCDKCIRDYVISKSQCICGATIVLADNFVPNNTLRNTIVSMLESINNGAAKGASPDEPKEMESAQCPQPKIQGPKIQSPDLSATSKGDVPENELNTKFEEMTGPVKLDNAEVSQAVHECVREPGSQICPPVTDEEIEPCPLPRSQSDHSTLDPELLRTSPQRESATSKRRKVDSSSPCADNDLSHRSSHWTTLNEYRVDYRKNAAAVWKNSFKFAEDRDFESSDDDRHFKRRCFRYESSPALAVVEGRHFSRGSREKGVMAASIGILSVH